MIKVTLKNNKTNEEIETYYSIRNLISHGGEDLLVENIIENNVCHCKPVGEKNVIECNCWEEWEDTTLIIDEDNMYS
ncbi:hypothetical protein [Niallia circulans]|uniref:hypothetical protein n=1 Tax=Niallia circulans TaxID=1397 RepID=UPI0026F371A2|nr:hypothetical protein [Niallia circulans]